MTVETTTKDKHRLRRHRQITVDVPEDRVAEFYAFYGQFLAGFPGRRRTGFAGTGGPGRHGRGGPHGRRCGHHHEERPSEAAEPAGPETTTV